MKPTTLVMVRRSVLAKIEPPEGLLLLKPDGSYFDVGEVLDAGEYVSVDVLKWPATPMFVVRFDATDEEGRWSEFTLCPVPVIARVRDH